mgnify:CR=1 FL=1
MVLIVGSMMGSWNYKDMPVPMVPRVPKCRLLAISLFVCTIPRSPRIGLPITLLSPHGRAHEAFSPFFLCVRTAFT